MQDACTSRTRVIRQKRARSDWCSIGLRCSDDRRQLSTTSRRNAAAAAAAPTCRLDARTNAPSGNDRRCDSHGYTHLMTPSDRSSLKSRRQPVRRCIGTLTLRRKSWIELDGRFAIGEAGVELLRAIERRGSLAEGARQVGWSYRMGLRSASRVGLGRTADVNESRQGLRARNDHHKCCA
jgi:hypothetical protein